MSASPGDPRPAGGTHGEQPAIDGAADDVADASSVARIVAWSKATASTTQHRLERLLDEHRDRPVVDLGLRWYERDRDAAGTLVGSAIAFRLFLFFVPLLLFVVGIAGFLANYVETEDVDEMGITGNLARQMNEALTQPNSTRWIATFAGLFGMLWAGRSLTKVMAAASCLAWRRPVRAKASVRAIGATVGLVVGLGLVSGIVNKVRHDLGIGAAGVSFLAAFALYGTAWLLLSLVLPRTTADPGALLPGAVLVGATLSGLQAVSQLYLPNRFSHASELYGAVGVAIVTLGWFFIMGRVIVLSLSLDAVVYERFGSITTFVFGLPVLRGIARRAPWLRRFFGLGEFAGAARAQPPDPSSTTLLRDDETGRPTDGVSAARGRDA